MLTRLSAALAVLVVGAFVVLEAVDVPVGKATTLTFTPTDDAWIESAVPDASHGSDVTLVSDASPQRDALMKFNVVGVGSDTVTSAKLRVWVKDPSGCCKAKEVRSTGTTWSESTVTWNNAPVPGALLDSETTVGPIDAWFEFDVTSAVAGDGILAFRMPSLHSDGLYLHSKEGANAPQLVISTTGAGGPTPTPTASVITTATATPSGSASPIPTLTPTATATPSSPTPTPLPGTVTASDETDPAYNPEDAYDDSAIIADVVDPAKSVIVGTERVSDTRATQGIHVFDMAGDRVQFLPAGHVNNVDARRGFLLAGQKVMLVISTNRTTGKMSIFRYQDNWSTTPLIEVTASSAPVISGHYGFCLYRSRLTNRLYGFLSKPGTGVWNQLEFTEAPGGTVTYSIVRTINHPLQPESTTGELMEGCAADDRRGYVYLAEEAYGIWRYEAEPTGSSTGVAVATVAAGELVPAVEGLTIYDSGPGYYLLASNQSSENTFSVFALHYLNDDAKYLGRFSIVTGAVDGTSHTDGIDVSHAYLGPLFPRGVFVVQDSNNSLPGNSGNDNFKMVPWERIRDSLRLD